jgi:hypothetical protein
MTLKEGVFLDLTLDAIAGDQANFVGWSGACTSAGADAGVNPAAGAAGAGGITVGASHAVSFVAVNFVGTNTLPLSITITTPTGEPPTPETGVANHLYLPLLGLLGVPASAADQPVVQIPEPTGD